MARLVKSYEPEERVYVDNGLYCTHCGNTNQWQINLKLKHQVECLSNTGLSVTLDKQQTKKILKAIENNLINMVDKAIDNDKTIFTCANCQNNWIDFHERIMDSCLWSGCMGCFHCGNWIDEEELLDLCTECINDKKGQITEDDCDSLCPNSDFGLREVMWHYNLTLEKIKQNLGY